MVEKGVLLACYVTRRGDGPQEGEGRSMAWDEWGSGHKTKAPVKTGGPIS